MDINSLIGSVDSPKLRASLKKMMDDPKSRELLNNLKSVDKNQLNSIINSINANKIPTDAIVNQIENNPNLINQLNSIISKKTN